MFSALRGVIAGLLMLLGCLAALPAWAGPYEVAGVFVRETADNAVAAKERAIAEGQARALQIVLQRITHSSDHARLPQVPPERVQDYVAFFGLDDEQTSATTYTASLNFRFEPSSVRQLLEQHGIYYVENQAPPAFVVPVFRMGGEIVFAGNNPVLQAWQSYDVHNTLTPVKLPAGDVTEHGLAPRAVIAREPDAMSTLRYVNDTQYVLIALCEAEDADARITCSLRGNAPVGEVDLEESYAGGSDPLAVAQSAAGSFLGVLEDRWKDQGGRLSFDQGGAPTGIPVQVRVAFSGLAEWQALRGRLSELPGVSGIEIVSLNARGAMLSVYYAGTGWQLSDALAATGLNLSDAGDHWVLQAN